MKKWLALLLACVLLCALPALAQEEQGENEGGVRDSIRVSFSLYEGDCNLVDDESKFIAWQRVPGGEKAGLTDEYYASSVEFFCDYFLEEYWQDDFEPTNERVCRTREEHTNQVRVTVRVHRGGAEGVPCATWTDKRYACTNCGYEGTDQILDRQEHPYWESDCLAWNPALTVDPEGAAAPASGTNLP